MSWRIKMIYFDNASTTAVSEPVLELVYDMLKNNYANPSSLHSAGFEVEKLITRSREQIARALRVKSDGIYFTSGGTEANNTAVLGAARAAKRNGMHLITSVIEHPSVADSFALLEEEGFEVTYLPVDERGYVSVEDLKAAMRPDTTLVSIMYVNNEVGTIQAISELVAAAKAVNPHCVFHTDCVQAFGKHKIPTANVDMISVSGHKIHAPKGVGALYVKQGTRLKSLHFGGGQENGVRPGTENTASIVGFGLAAELAVKNTEDSFNAVKAVKTELLNNLADLDGVFVNGDVENASPYILNLSFKDVKGEVLLHALENSEIFVATGSACSSKLKKKRKIVDLLVDGRGENNIRLSFSEFNTVDEARTVAEVIKKEVPVLRRFKAR
jgi:cysteine desulfurase